MSQNYPPELRGQLEAQKAEYTERVAKIKADLAKGLEANSVEQATQLENQEVLKDLINEALEQRVQIDAALVRMDNGSYGVCGTCGKPIDINRLEAYPAASACIDCA